MGTKSKPKNLRVWRYRPLQPHHLISIQYLRFNFLQMIPFTWVFICPSNNAFTSISCFSMSHQRATWEKVRGASLSNFKDQANRPRGRSDVLLQGHHLKIFQVQPYEEKLPWRMMRWQEGERGAMSLCLCEEWAGADVEMIVNRCALISRSPCFLVCRGQALTSTRYPTRPELYSNPTRIIFQNFRV